MTVEVSPVPTYICELLCRTKLRKLQGATVIAEITKEAIKIPILGLSATLLKRVESKYTLQKGFLIQECWFLGD